MEKGDRKEFWEALIANAQFVNPIIQSDDHFLEFSTKNLDKIRVDVYIDQSTIDRYHGDVVISLDADQFSNIFCYVNAKNINNNTFISEGRIGFSRQFNLSNKGQKDHWQEAIDWICHGLVFFAEMYEKRS